MYVYLLSLLQTRFLYVNSYIWDLMVPVSFHMGVLVDTCLFKQNERQGMG